MGLLGKVVIITGASTDIGSSAANAFAIHGFKIVLVGRNEADLKETEAICKAANSNVEILTIAAVVKTDAAKIIKSTIGKFGQLDVLVNIPDIAERGTILDVDAAKFDDIMKANVRSVFLLTKHAAPHLIEAEGNIVNVSSAAGLRLTADSSRHCTTKAALFQLTRCIALLLASKNIRVNAINAGANMTELQKVTHLILLLANDRCSCLTGATLPTREAKKVTSPR